VTSLVTYYILTNQSINLSIKIQPWNLSTLPLPYLPNNMSSSVASSRYSVSRLADEYNKSQSKKKNNNGSGSVSGNGIPRQANNFIASPSSTHYTFNYDETPQKVIATESQMALLCLDHLRTLRRKVHHQNHNQINATNNACKDEHERNGLKLNFNEDYLTLAVYALSRAFASPSELSMHHENDRNSGGLGAGAGSGAGAGNGAIGNDAFFQSELSITNATAQFKQQQQQQQTNDTSIISMSNDNMETIGSLTPEIDLPTLSQMESEIIYQKKPVTGPSPTKKSSKTDSNPKSKYSKTKPRPEASVDVYSVDKAGGDPMEWYLYDDEHPSNQDRIYPYRGISSTPFDLPTLVSVSMNAYSAKARREGEYIMTKDSMFVDFVEAVKFKGFFNVSDDVILARIAGKNSENDNGNIKSPEGLGNGIRAIANPKQMDMVREQIYQERYRKVVNKFRYKLEEKMIREEEEEEIEAEIEAASGSTKKRRGSNRASASKVEKPSPVPVSVSAIANYNYNKGDDASEAEATVAGSVLVDRPMPMKSSASSRRQQQQRRKSSTCATTGGNSSSRTSLKDVEEAERQKAKGNVYMQKKKYTKAKNCYTTALQLAPQGPTSHVYYSNRSAALLSMRNFSDAVHDAEKSIALKPDYPKAHARLGLSHFLLGRFSEAVASYTLAVRYEPTNQTSLSYLERSKKKLLAETASRFGSGSVSVAGTHHDDDMTSVSSRVSVRSNGDRRQSTIPFLARKPSSAGLGTRSSHQHRQHHDNSLTPERDVNISTSSRKANVNASLDMSLSRSRSGLDEFPREYNEDSSINLNVVQSASSGSLLSMSTVKRKARVQEADKIKIEGNKAMARKEYAPAIKLYSKALRLAPAGPSSHVYFANRAAALCYLERYEEAELDSERSLALVPEFSKAHARLGLSRYFLKDYEGAVDAYETALVYDPQNESNRIYLAKAKFKLSRRKSSHVLEE